MYYPGPGLWEFRLYETYALHRDTLYIDKILPIRLLFIINNIYNKTHLFFI